MQLSSLANLNLLKTFEQDQLTALQWMELALGGYISFGVVW